MTAGEPKTSFRLRSAYLGHLVVGSGDGAVLIEPSVAGELRMAAALAGRHPAAGLLYGHSWHDDDGGYTLVDGYVPAASAGTATVHPDPAVVRARLREEAALSYPDATEVGWWRTALRPGEEGPGEEGWPDPGTWPLGERPEGIGLVVFADGTPPATAVLNPHSVVQGSVIEDWLRADAPREQRIPEEPTLVMESEPLHAAPISPLPDDRPTRGRTGPPIQSPLLVNQSELRSRRRHEVEPERGLRAVEPQHWVLLAMVILSLAVVVTIIVMVSAVFH